MRRTALEETYASKGVDRPTGHTSKGVDRPIKGAWRFGSSHLHGLAAEDGVGAVVDDGHAHEDREADLAKVAERAEEDEGGAVGVGREVVPEMRRTSDEGAGAEGGAGGKNANDSASKSGDTSQLKRDSQNSYLRYVKGKDKRRVEPEQIDFGRFAAAKPLDDLGTMTVFSPDDSADASNETNTEHAFSSPSSTNWTCPCNPANRCTMDPLVY